MGVPLIDLHIDTLAQVRERGIDPLREGRETHVDVPRLARSDVQAAVWAVCSASGHEGWAGTSAALQMLGGGLDLVRRGLGRVRLVLGPEDLDACIGGAPVGMILGLEGAHPLQGRVDMLRAFHALGVRVLTLCWNTDTPFATGCALEQGTDRGLSPMGRDLLRLAAELPVVLDLAHASPRTLADAVGILKAPFMVSHTACAALCAHRRNLSDDQMKAVVEAGGLIGITLYPPFLASGGASVSIGTVCDHILHGLAVVGEAHLAIGSDFDGVTRLPEGMAGVQDLPRVLDELRVRGLSEREIEALAWRNAARVLRAGLQGSGT
jgi:membrane dipeptidase